jgi:hypothetical protein
MAGVSWKIGGPVPPMPCRMVLRKVHPDTARAWQEVAGPAVQIDMSQG